MRREAVWILTGCLWTGVPVLGQSVAEGNLRFVSHTLSLDTLSEDDAPHKRVFDFQNAGKNEVVITQVLTGCGCTRADYTRNQIAPGEKGSVTLSFNPRHRPGEVNVRATVYTAEKGVNHTYVLSLSGHVTPTKDKWQAYRYRMGDLRLMRKDVSLSVAGKTATERIACANSGTEPLKVKFAQASLPKGLTVRTDPEVLPPGGEGDLVFTVQTDLLPKKSGTYFLLIEDNQLTPSQRAISVKIHTATE